MKGIFSVLLLSFGLLAQAQVKDPVKWSFESKKINDKTYELHITATLDPKWHIYTIDHKGDIGVATSVSVNKNPLGSTSGKLKVNGKPVKSKDPSTGEMVSFYENRVTFVQTVALSKPVKTTFTGAVEYMACDDKQCLPPTTRSFSIALN